jgi:hypothetical protein
MAIWDYVSPDIFQEKMSELMTGLDFARAYLDDLLIISTETGFNKHLEKLEQVLNRLSEAGLKINAVKSFFGRTNLEYLGYNFSREGIRPSQKKIDAILQIKPPTTRKQLRRFIGMVNYYCDMWPLRSHLLAPLSSLTSAKVKWKWTTEHQEAFDKMKRLLKQKKHYLPSQTSHRNLKYILMPVNYNYKHVSPKTVNRLPSTQEDCNLLNQDIQQQKENYYLL